MNCVRVCVHLCVREYVCKEADQASSVVPVMKDEHNYRKVEFLELEHE